MIPMLLLAAFTATAQPAVPPPLKVLFLGDNAGHQPVVRFRILQPVFAARNIALTYTDKLTDLNAENLGKYDGLMIYANHDAISPDQEKALLDYAASGKGFIPVHCASYCFRNSPGYVALVGAQFRSHTSGVFRVEDVAPTHPIMKGFQSFASWDETYTHTKHNEKDRTVLEVRTEGDVKEPWTWVRTPEKARVFYTAWGHDQRTWGHPGFHNLLERGVRWSCGQNPALAGTYFDRPEMTAKRTDVKPFEYTEAKIPLYLPKSGRGGSDQQNKMQKPLLVDESLKHFVVPKGFEVRTFVTEDKLGGKPIAMTWDEQGRLWVSITADYPNELKPTGEGRDKIVICSDADGDGVCDTVTTFADKLSIPTSLLNYAGGVIVTQAPDTLFLKDTDGDGKADLRQVLFTGWGTGDTHAGPSNLRYGFDNWIYGAVGYSAFNGEVNGEKVSFRQGFYRFKIEASGEPNKLKTTKLEFLRSTSNNTWGFGFSEDGQMFGSTANGCALVHLPIPNRYYEKVRGLTPSVLPPINLDNHIEPITEKVRQVDWHGGFTAAAGCTIYTARTYPQEYWNRTAFVTEPTGHLAATFVLQPNGSDFTARYGWNLIASDDEWSAPIETAVGPDGQMWVIDWYNFIVQHNPTPQGFKTGKGNAYETDLRDKSHGRIYRVVYTGAMPEPRVNLKDATPDKLVETLKNPNMTWRLHAQRLLVDRGNKDAIPALTKLLASDSDAMGTVHALWALNGLGAFRGWPNPLLESLSTAAANPTPAVRRNVIEAAKPYLLHIKNAEKLFTDPSPEVRVAAFLALADDRPIPDFNGNILLPISPSSLVSRAAFDPATWNDRNLADAVTVAAGTHPGEFLVQLVFEKYPTQPTLDPRTVALIESAAKQFAAKYEPEKDQRILIDVLGPLSQAHAKFMREPIVNGLSSGWVAGQKADITERREAFNRLLKELSPVSRARLIKVAAMWGVAGLDDQLSEITNGLITTVANTKAEDATRLDAARQLLEFRPDDDATASKLLDALGKNPSAPFTISLLEVLGVSKAKALGGLIVARVKDLPPTARPAALRLVLARPESAKVFLDAVEKGELRFDMLALDQKTDLANHPDKALSSRARKLLALGGGLPDANRQKVIEELHAVIEKSGDVANGKKVFTTHCAKCHKHSGEGQQIGPDLTGMSVHPKEELLIHILDPSRSVEGNYRAFTAQTLDGRTITGLLAAETKTTVELIDAENKRHAINRDDLDSLKESTKSLMPEGFEKQAKPQELVDLLEFLTQKGKFVPLPLDRAATVVSTKGMFYSEDAGPERLIFPDWKPKSFNGVPFVLVDPQGTRIKNAILLRSANGTIPPTMPESVTVPCNAKAKTIHLLSGVSGWGATEPAKNGSVSMIVRLHYADGKTEDHPLRNGVHFADYIRRVDVPESQFAFALRGQQIRYLSVTPKRVEPIKQIEFVKGPDRTAPIVMAVTAESP